MHSFFGSRLIFISVGKSLVARHDNCHCPGAVVRDQKVFQIRLAHCMHKSMVNLYPITITLISVVTHLRMNVGLSPFQACLFMASSLKVCSAQWVWSCCFWVWAIMSHRYALCSLNTLRTEEFWLLWFPTSPLCCNHKLACPAVSWLREHCHQHASLPHCRSKISALGRVQFTEVCYYPSVPGEISWLRGLQGSTLCCLSSTGSVKKTTSFWNQSVQYKHSGGCSAHTVIQGVYSFLYEIISVVCNIQDVSSAKHPCGSVAKLLASFLTRGTGLRGYLGQARSSQLWSSKLIIIWSSTQCLKSGTQASHSSPEEHSVFDDENHKCHVC